MGRQPVQQMVRQAWLMAAATLPGRKGHEIYYEPVPQWSTGMGGIAIVD